MEVEDEAQIWHCCAVGQWPLAWEPAYAVGVALKRPKKKRGKLFKIHPFKIRNKTSISSINATFYYYVEDLENNTRRRNRY